MSLPMTPNPTGLDVSDAAVERRLARVFASSARDDEADAAFGIAPVVTVTVRPDGGRAMAEQRARMHATAVVEAPRRGIDAVDPEDMF